jgi:hypothetical protein
VGTETLKKPTRVNICNPHDKLHNISAVKLFQKCFILYFNTECEDMSLASGQQVPLRIHVSKHFSKLLCIIQSFRRDIQICLTAFTI